MQLTKVSLNKEVCLKVFLQETQELVILEGFIWSLVLNVQKG